MIGAIRYLLDHDISGPVNLTGPEPVTNAEFTRALGAVLHRPAVLPVPRFGPRLIARTRARRSTPLLQPARRASGVGRMHGYRFPPHATSALRMRLAAATRLNVYFGCMRMPPSTRIVSAFM